ncbi:TPA: hypothetical protein EYN65_12815 [Candidatus Poribacteria bacterium]|nr:hypothetical protein [Candidatus Poribacteria bacterium]
MLENKKGRTITFRVNDEAAQKLETYAKSDTLATAVHIIRRIVFQRKRADAKTVSPHITSHHAEWHSLI